MLACFLWSRSVYVKANLGSGHMLSRPVRGSIVLHWEMVQIFTAMSSCRLMGRYPVLCVSSLFILSEVEKRWVFLALCRSSIVCEQEGKTNRTIIGWQNVCSNIVWLTGHTLCNTARWSFYLRWYQSCRNRPESGNDSIQEVDRLKRRSVLIYQYRLHWAEE